MPEDKIDDEGGIRISACEAGLLLSKFHSEAVRLIVLGVFEDVLFRTAGFITNMTPGGFILETEPKPGRIVVAIGDCLFGFNGEHIPVPKDVEDMVPEGWASSLIINFRNGSLLVLYFPRPETS